MKKRLLLLLLAVFVVLSLVPQASAAPTIAEMKDNLAALQEKLSDIKTEQARVEIELEELDTNLSITLAKKQILDEKIEASLRKIENLGEQIVVYGELIAEKESEVNALIEDENAQWDLYKTRIRAMEENGAVSYYAIIFGASDFTDMLSRIDAVNAIMEYDESVYLSLIAAENSTRAAQAELEEYRAGLESAQAEEAEAERELEADREEASALIAQLEADKEERAAYLAEIEADRDEVMRQTLEVQAAIKKAEEEERRRLEEQRRLEELARREREKVVGTGDFIWPAQYQGRITDTFRLRTDHPVYHDQRPHEGLDIGGQGFGAKIYASDSGRVITSAYSSSYGNYVVIDHGNGYCTLYAHMQSRKVSAGDKVTQGDVIGYVGSTGASTGPHLHFEIWKDGTKIDPAPFFSNLKY